MDSPYSPSDSSLSGLQLFGLPHRPAGDSGRDPLEAALTDYLLLARSADAPPLEDYIRGFPAIADELRELLPLAVAMEGWKHQREVSDFQARLAAGVKFDRLGEFRILREIGRGGMGLVYEAEQDTIGRRVAVKILPSRFTRNAQGRERFLREARTAAALKHPHIVPVFSYGEHEGLCYYAMQLIEGIGLDKAIALLRKGEGGLTPGMVRDTFHAAPPPVRGAEETNPLAGAPAPRPAAAPLPAAPRPDEPRILKRNGWLQFARLTIQVCHALRHAHASGTLHRDIKPANLLLDGGGRIWVADFGLAQDLSPSTTSPGMAGTLRYMAPEQFHGKVDARSDVYALGVTLYELCMLRPAFLGETREELAEAVHRGRVPRPRKVEPRIPAALEAIILKSIARNPEDRYESAAALLTDLLKFLKRAQRTPPRRGLGRLFGFFGKSDDSRR